MSEKRVPGPAELRLEKSASRTDTRSSACHNSIAPQPDGSPRLEDSSSICFHRKIDEAAPKNTIVGEMRLTWTFTPADFFDVPLECEENDYRLEITKGKAVADLTDNCPASPDEIERALKLLFLVAQLDRHRPFTLSDYSSHWIGRDGIGHIGVRVSDRLEFRDSPPEVMLRDVEGNVLLDSRAKKIIELKELFFRAVKNLDDATLITMLGSYNKSVDDPANELVHLYEIRDALAAQFGDKKGRGARRALSLEPEDWGRFEALANNEPLSQGRHRGFAGGQLRTATESELAECRSVAATMIRDYINYLTAGGHSRV